MAVSLVILFGRPGAGKLTIGRSLAERTGWRLFHNHLAVDLALSLFEFGSPGFVELREEVWIASLSRAASSGLPGVIFTFAPESTVRPSFIPALIDRFEGAGGTVHLVELTCEREEIHRRLAMPGRATYGKLRDVAMYERLATGGHFDRPAMPPAHHRIDVTHTAPETVAAEIARAIGWMGEP